MDFLELVESRYSVRDYQDKAIEEDKMALILKAGQLAPTAANKQPQKIYILKSQAALEKIRSITRCAFNAPVVLMFAYDGELDWKNKYQEGIHAGEQDVSIVATHMMLEAANLGIGSCWVNAFANDQAKAAFNLPTPEQVVLLMPLGYASSEATPSVMHSTYRDQHSIVEVK